MSRGANTLTRVFRRQWSSVAGTASLDERRPGDTWLKILICDDHAIFRQGLKTVLADLDADIVEAAGSDEALAHLDRDASADVVLLDLHMPGDDGWTALRKLRSRHPEVPVVIVSASQEPGDAKRALDQGASGYVPKSSGTSVFRSALQLVLDGSLYIPPMLLDEEGAVPRDRGPTPASERPVLTARQREILQLMSRGLTNAEISEMLRISENTVKTHISAILSALDVSNRTEAVLVMRDMGLEP